MESGTVPVISVEMRFNDPELQETKKEIRKSFPLRLENAVRQDLLNIIETWFQTHPTVSSTGGSCVLVVSPSAV
jgi:hypothetical protein